jgi:Vitamin-D-receptor interacting Mediator subunit 4
MLYVAMLLTSILVSQHQANYARIVQLRQTAENLDQQIKNTITLLADTRKELLDTPFTSFSTKSRDVPFDELLQFAKNISKFTVPPTVRPRLQANGTGIEPVATKLDSASPAENGAEPISLTVAEQPHGGATDKGVAEAPETEARGIGWLNLGEEQKQWLDQMANRPFVPWPSDDVVKAGALAAIYDMLDKGEDPAKMGMPEAGVASSTRPTDADEDGNLSEVDDHHMDAQRDAQAPTRQAVANPAQAFVGFGLYNPDEDA